MKKALKIIVPLMLAALIIASIGWYLFVYDRPFARDVLLGQARYHSEQGNIKLSSWFYDLAYEHSGQDKNVAIELANQYEADGNYTKAEYTLTNAIADGATVELYTALCRLFVEQDKLLDAVNMLERVSDPALKEQLNTLRPAAPTADPLPGFFSEYISVSFAEQNGITYFTSDGDYPSTSDTIYIDPIPLSIGETTIKAICVGQNGLVSPLTTASYTVGGVIELVEFQDAAVEHCLRTQLGLEAEEEIFTSTLWTVTEFTYPAEGESFDDLAYLPYLKTLTIKDKTIDSLSCLSGLTKLESLTLVDCSYPVEDLMHLTLLPKLERLTMDNCGLSTIANLANAQSITYLDLSNNTLRNLEPLANMTTLQELHLDHNAVTALNALSGLTNLETLDVSYNSVTSIAPLVTCPKLSTLLVGNNEMETLDAIENMASLTVLSVEHNMLAEVSVLGQCTGLKELDISNNQITDISALSPLTALEVFRFAHNSVEALPQWESGMLKTIDGSHNAVENIDVLGIMEDLTYVYMDYNNLDSVDAIADCFMLVLVNVYGNPIEDVSALTAHNIIVNYDPT